MVTKFYEVKIVPKVVPTLGSISKNLYEFCDESQINGRATKLNEPKAMALFKTQKYGSDHHYH